MKQCHYCQETKELRPYGPKGSYVCYNCGTAPEHAEETKRNFDALLAAACKVSSIVVFDSEEGPMPASADPRLKEIMPQLEEMHEKIKNGEIGDFEQESGPSTIN